MSAEQQKRMEDTATTLVRRILLEHFPSTVEDMEKAASIIGARWANHTLAAIGAARQEAADEIEHLKAENRTLRNVGISQMDQINRLLAQQTSS